MTNHDILWCHILGRSRVSLLLPLSFCVAVYIRDEIHQLNRLMYLFIEYMFTRETSFSTVVYVNNEHITVLANIQRYTQVENKLLFCYMKKPFFIIYIICVFILKGQKKIMFKIFIDLACTAMYTMFACGEQAGFVFTPSSCSRRSC